MTTIDHKIRKYESRDRDAVREICADTGLLGNPIDPIFSDRELFSDMINGYYLRKEPDHTFVAEVDGQVVGYLTGSINRFAHLGLALNGIKPVAKAVYRQLTGKYGEHPQNKEFLKWLFTRAPFEMPSHPKKAAHAHFNLRDGVRHEGIGTELIETALETLAPELQQRDIRRIYGEVFAHPQKPEEYFREAGFDIFDRKRTTMFRDHVEGDIYLLCITKELR